MKEDNKLEPQKRPGIAKSIRNILRLRIDPKKDLNESQSQVTQENKSEVSSSTTTTSTTETTTTVSTAKSMPRFDISSKTTSATINSTNQSQQRESPQITEKSKHNSFTSDNIYLPAYQSVVQSDFPKPIPFDSPKIKSQMTSPLQTPVKQFGQSESRQLSEINSGSNLSQTSSNFNQKQDFQESVNIEAHKQEEKNVNKRTKLNSFNYNLPSYENVLKSELPKPIRLDSQQLTPNQSLSKTSYKPVSGNKHQNTRIPVNEPQLQPLYVDTKKFESEKLLPSFKTSKDMLLKLVSDQNSKETKKSD